MPTTRNLTLREPRLAGTTLLERKPGVEPTPPRRPEPRDYLRWLLPVALLVAIGIALLYRAELATYVQPASLAHIRTAEVRSGIIEQRVRLTGTTVAEKSAVLRAPYLRGRRSAGSRDFGLVLLDLGSPGARVRKNDIVAEFDQIYMQNRLDDHRASRVERELGLRTLLAEIEVRRSAYRQEIRVAKATMDKAALDLKTAPVRSAIRAALYQLDFEEAKATYEALLAQAKYVELMEKAEIRLAQLLLREEQIEERRAAANVAKMLVRAPVDGLLVVTEIFRGAEFGQIRAGDELRPGRPYAQIVDPRSMIIEATANQVDLENLRIGARAQVRVDAYSDLELPARVYSIGPLAKVRRWRANYVSEVPVFLKLDRVDARLIPNLTVSADIILHRESSDGIIPREAVFHDAGGENPFAYVQTPSGWEKRELWLGLANHLEAAVASGLSQGEVVAVTDPSA